MDMPKCHDLRWMSMACLPTAALASLINITIRAVDAPNPLRSP